MNLIAKHCILAVLVGQFAGVFTLDCTDSPGISYDECGPTGSGGGGGGVSRELLTKCTLEEFTGPGRKLYEYTKSDFELVIVDISGGELIIQNFRCNPGDVCKVAVIQPDVSVPVSIPMNKAKFALTSGSSVSVKFYIDDDCESAPGCYLDSECSSGQVCCNMVCADSCDPCEASGYESFGPRWVKQSTNMKWEECRQYCEVTMGGRMFTVKNQAEWDAVKSYINGQFWLGFKQFSQFQYRWSWNAETFTMNNNGTILEYGNWHPWVSGSPAPQWDKNGGQDNKDCVSTNHIGWTEKICDSNQRCLCDCTLNLGV